MAPLSIPQEGKTGVRTQVSSGGVVFRHAGTVVEIALISVGRARRWQLPKGTVDKGETLEIAAVREVREETGIAAELLNPLGVIEYWFYAGIGQRERIHKFVHFYLMRFIAGSTNDHDDEVNEAKWVEIEKALDTLSFANERGIVEKARKMIKVVE